MTHSHDTATPAMSVESEEAGGIWITLASDGILKGTGLRRVAEIWQDQGLGVAALPVAIPAGLLDVLRPIAEAAAPAPNPSPAAKGGEAEALRERIARALNSVLGSEEDEHPRYHPAQKSWEEPSEVWWTQWLEAADAVVAALASDPAPAGEAVEPVEANNLAFERFVLWFFRELSEDQRLALFSLFGWPVSEITSTGAAKRVLRAIITPILPEDTARLREDLERVTRELAEENQNAQSLASDLSGLMEDFSKCQRERDVARKELETANALISDARSCWWSHRLNERAGPLAAVWDRLVAADDAARSASREGAFDE